MTLRRYTALRSKPQADPVTAEVRRFVLARDGECLAAKLGFEHVCRDRYGRTHAADARALLSIEHVKSDLAMGQRAPSDPSHLVALCCSKNVAVPSKAMREAFREYLAGVA